MNLKLKLSISFLVSSLIAFSVVGVLGYFTISKHFEEMTEELLASEAVSISNFVSSIQKSLDQDILDDWIKKLKRDESKNFSNSFFDNENWRSYQIWKDGQLIARTKIGPDLKELKYDVNDIYVVSEPNGKTWRILDQKIGGQDIWISLAIETEDTGTIVLIVLALILSPFLLIILVLTMLIYIITEKIMYSPVRELSNLLRNNDRLEPFQNVKEWPEELMPIVENVNEILYKAKYLQTKLDNSLKNEKNFTANASHELLTPLAAIKSEAQLLELADSSENRHRSLSEIIKRVDRATHTIDQLIILSRLDPEDTGSHFEKLNLVGVIQNSIILHNKELEIKNIKVEFPEESKFVINGVRPILEILFRNIISNCTKYSIKDSTIKVEFLHEGDTSKIKITNSSEPLPHYIQDFIFDRFVRGPQEKETGVGLGMAISKRIVEIHKGDLSFRQLEDKETVETIISF